MHSEEMLRIRILPSYSRVWLLAFCLGLAAIFLFGTTSTFLTGNGSVVAGAVFSIVITVILASSVATSLSSVVLSADFSVGLVTKHMCILGIAVRSRVWQEIVRIHADIAIEWSTQSEGHDAVTMELTVEDKHGEHFLVMKRWESILFPPREKRLQHPRVVVSREP